MRRQSFGGVNISSANLTITVTRTGADIASPLPFAMFAAVENSNEYRRLVQEYLPAGVTLSSVASDANDRSLVFSYTDGVNTDIVTVACTGAPYTIVLEASKFDLIKFDSIKYGVNQAANLNQKTIGIDMVNTSIFGKLEKVPFTPNDYTNPSDNIETQVYIPLTGTLDKTTGFVSNMIATDGVQSSFVFYVNTYKKYDASVLALRGLA